MKAQLINLGRGKVNKEIEVKNTKELHKEIGKHLASKGWGMDETDTPDLWEVNSGMRIVGHVKILEP